MSRNEVLFGIIDLENKLDEWQIIEINSSANTYELRVTNDEEIEPPYYPVNSNDKIELAFRYFEEELEINSLEEVETAVVPIVVKLLDKADFRTSINLKSERILAESCDYILVASNGFIRG